MPARFFIPKADWNTNTLLKDEAKHALKILRLKQGAQIELFDGAGTSANATISTISGKEVTFEISTQKTTSPTIPAIHLYQSVPKGKNMDLIIQKAVEMGVSAIYPIITENTVAVSDSPEKKTEKWQRIAIEACKQCKQPWLPTVHPPQSFSKITNFAESLKIVASLRHGARPMKEVLAKPSPPKAIALLVGPEGDFTERELDHAEANEFQPVTLGDLTLRVETATLFTISAVRYQFM